jgi:hypothetical protein
MVHLNGPTIADVAYWHGICVLARLQHSCSLSRRLRGGSGVSSVTLVNSLAKMLGAEQRGILQTRRAAHLALRRMMLRRSWFGRLGLRLGFVAA